MLRRCVQRPRGASSGRLPAGPPGSERTRAAGREAPSKKWNCEASPCSRICKKTKRKSLLPFLTKLKKADFLTADTELTDQSVNDEEVREVRESILFPPPEPPPPAPPTFLTGRPV